MKSKAHSKLLHTKPWDENANQFWLASTIQLKRNIDRFPFPEKLSKEKKNQIVSLLCGPLLEQPFLEGAEVFPIEDVRPVEKEYLVEHFLSPSSFHHTHSGEAFVLDQSGKCLITMNVENHVQFELIDCSGEIEGAWNLLSKIEASLGKEVEYAFSKKFGYLTSFPQDCGTGFVLTVFLQPSALIHTGKIDVLLKKLVSSDFKISGLQGNPNEVIGDVYALRNRYTLGVTEETIISSVRSLTTKLLVEENSARNALRGGEDPDVMDRVSRAYGMTMHSYQAEPIEVLGAISLLKLGADLGWLKGVTPRELNALFFQCRRAHLLLNFPKEITQEELPHKRAEFIHKTLKRAKLTI